jgi:CheY-like chemotaxis protein
MTRSATAPSFLLVDDHAGFRQMVRDFLPADHGEIFECGDGAAAIESFETHHPDWILMDVEMPVLDGLEATRCIRKLNPEADIVILTHYATPDLRDAALEAGASHFLPKDNLGALRGLLESSADSDHSTDS